MGECGQSTQIDEQEEEEDIETKNGREKEVGRISEQLRSKINFKLRTWCKYSSRD